MGTQVGNAKPLIRWDPMEKEARQLGADQRPDSGRLLATHHVNGAIAGLAPDRTDQLIRRLRSSASRALVT